MREALARGACAATTRVFLMGEDVGRYGGCFAVSLGLLEEFGPERIRDTPLSESAFVGAGIGAAIGGMRPIVEIMTVNFSLLALDQILNNAATLLHMSGGQVNVPLVIRMTTGAGRQLGRPALAQPGGLVRPHPRAAGARAGDPRGRPRHALAGAAGPRPGADLRARLALRHGRASWPRTPAPVDIARAAVRRAGDDVTLVTYGGSLRQDADGGRAAGRRRASTPRSSTCASLRPLDDETIVGVGAPHPPRGRRRRGLAQRQPVGRGHRPDHRAGVLRPRRARSSGSARPRCRCPTPGTSRRPRCRRSATIVAAARAGGGADELTSRCRRSGADMDRARCWSGWSSPGDAVHRATSWPSSTPPRRRSRSRASSDGVVGDLLVEPGHRGAGRDAARWPPRAVPVGDRAAPPPRRGTAPAPGAAPAAAGAAATVRRAAARPWCGTAPPSSASTSPTSPAPAPAAGSPARTSSAPRRPAAPAPAATPGRPGRRRRATGRPPGTPSGGPGHAVRPPAGRRARGRPRRALTGPRRAARSAPPTSGPRRPTAPVHRRRPAPARPAPRAGTVARQLAGRGDGGRRGPHRRIAAADEPVEAGDPALLPGHHRRPGRRADLAARAQPGPAGRRAAGARRRCCSRPTALAARRCPQLNGFWVDDAFRPAARRPPRGRDLAARRRAGGPGLHDADLLASTTSWRALRDLVAPGPRRPAARVRADRPDAHRDQPRRPGGGVGARGDLPAAGRAGRHRPGRRPAAGRSTGCSASARSPDAHPGRGPPGHRRLHRRPVPRRRRRAAADTRRSYDHDPDPRPATLVVRTSLLRIVPDADLDGRRRRRRPARRPRAGLAGLPAVRRAARATARACGSTRTTTRG